MSSLDLAGAAGTAALDASRLSDADKRELQQFVQNETQKAGIQDSKSRTPAPSFSQAFAGVFNASSSPAPPLQSQRCSPTLDQIDNALNAR